MLITFGLWGLYVTDALTPWRIVGLGFLAGLAGGFQNSTWQAFIPLLVPEAEMLDAVKLNSVQFTLARAIGPAVAGIVLIRWGSGVAIFVNALDVLARDRCPPGGRCRERPRPSRPTPPCAKHSMTAPRSCGTT